MIRRIIAGHEWGSQETLQYARRLLGKLLVVRVGTGRIERFRICEVEAYDGPEDRASHAFRGRTSRTEVMFGPAGRWYVYLCYGVHEMLNLVTGPVDYPAAVLIRGLVGVVGPGRLTKRLAIDRRFNAKRATRAAGLWLEDDGLVVPDREIQHTPRVGIAFAGPEWAAKPWRLRWTPGAMADQASGVEVSGLAVAPVEEFAS